MSCTEKVNVINKKSLNIELYKYLSTDFFFSMSWNMCWNACFFSSKRTKEKKKTQLCILQTILVFIRSLRSKRLSS